MFSFIVWVQLIFIDSYVHRILIALTLCTSYVASNRNTKVNNSDMLTSWSLLCREILKLNLGCTNSVTYNMLMMWA